MRVVVDKPEEAARGGLGEDLRLIGVRTLGFAGELLLVQSTHSGEIYGWPPARFTEAGLLLLAPRQSWVAHFDETARGRLPVDRIQDAIFDACRQVGPVDLGDVRGRGAWADRLDDADVIAFNAGPSVMAAGREWPHGDAPLERAYAVAPPLLRLGEPAALDERMRVLELCEALPWRDPRSGRLFAGLLAIAPICGALDWRPHAWLRAPASTGKSWILNNVVGRVLGGQALYLTGNVTEPAFRRALGRDARFVVVDEAEVASEEDVKRLRSILQHARHLSSDSMSVAARADVANGGVERFPGRGSCLFASVATPRFDEADAGRFTIFELASNADRSDYEIEAAREISAALAASFGPGFPARFLAAALEAAPVVRANHEAFARAIAKRGHNRRLGDQEGALLAGALFLEGEDRALDMDEASERLDAIAWTRAPPLVEPDHAVCLAALLSAQLAFDVREGRGRQTLSLARAVQVAARAAAEPDLSAEAIARTLREQGVRVEASKVEEGGMRFSGDVFLARGSTLVRRALERTPFTESWSDVLRQCASARPSENPVRFAGGVKQRAIALPIDVFLDNGRSL